MCVTVDGMTTPTKVRVATSAAALGLLTTIFTTAPAAAVGIANKATNAGSYGHIYVTGKTIWGGKTWHGNLWDGQATSRSKVSVTRVTAVGEGRCRGRLYVRNWDGTWTYKGATEKVYGHMNRTVWKVKRGSCN